MRISDYLNPKTELNTWANFKELNWKQEGIILLVSTIAAVIFPLYGGFVAFRALTHHFYNVSKSTSNPEAAIVSSLREQELESTSTLKTPIISSQKSQEPVAEWKKMMYKGFSKQLDNMGYQHGTAEETGDCFFDAVAQELNRLNRLEPGSHFTKKKIRKDIEKHLETCDHDRYQNLQKTGEEHSYEEFCQRIGLCTEEITEGAPIWGNKTCLQLIADIYHVNIEVFSVMAFELSLFEGMDEQYKDFEKYQYQRKDDTGYELCSEITQDTIHPNDGEAGETIRLGNLARGVWGHYVPVY